jgi:hypothetical protein
MCVNEEGHEEFYIGENKISPRGGTRLVMLCIIYIYIYIYVYVEMYMYMNM